MALVVKDRVQETSTTIGTGTLTLSGAVNGFETFSSSIGNGNTTYYAIVGGLQWEVGIGTVGAGTLTRDTILSSSNSGSIVTLSSGTKNVFCTQPAGKSIYLDSSVSSITSYGVLTGASTSTGAIQSITSAGTSGQVLTSNGASALPTFQTINTGTAWQSVQTTGFTAVAGRGYPCNTTSAAFTVTLPSSATAGDYIQIVDYAGTFATNNLTLNPNGLKIQGSTLNKKIVTNREGIILTYVDSTQGWVVTTAANDGTLAIAGVPAAPTIGTATAVTYSSATVSFTAPTDNGGSTITSYTATSSPGNITGTLTQAGSGTITVTGLSGSTNYTFTVTATNAYGTSAASSASNQITTPAAAYTVDFLVVAGGGGNQVNQGSNRESGSGGGGLRTSYGGTSGGGASAESKLTFNVGTTYTVTVGAGASGKANGGDSSISGTGLTTVTSSGGGAGANFDGNAGTAGGCGGGGWYTGGGGSGTANQGYAGSTGYTGSPYGGCGGGAAGAGGRDTAVGAGLSVSITGGAVTYSTGGVSNNFPGTNRNANGAANTGQGAGGAANGGSGIVVLRMPTANYTGTTTGSPSVSTSGSDTILTFNASGSYTA